MRILTKSSARKASQLTLAAACLTTFAFVAPAAPQLASVEVGEEFSGGETTVFDATRLAFSLSARNLREEHRSSFFVGNSFFNENWVVAPASAKGRDGLGPLFNIRSCSGCHFKDGRSRPPGPDQPMGGMLLRISVPGQAANGGPLGHPIYGDQIQGRAIPGVPPEADVLVRYQTLPASYADGEKYELRKPEFVFQKLGYGPLPDTLLMSGRTAPHMMGLGLLEAVPASTLRSFADPYDKDADGISGKINRVWDVKKKRKVPGRFGWKAEQPTVLQQTAAAFLGDIGVSSSLFPGDNHSTKQTEAAAKPNGGVPEVSDKILNAVASYSRTLAVPARRDWTKPKVLRGKQLFTEANCIACHIPKMKTGDWKEFPELSQQTIRPYTDLLLHDMGDGLADGRPAFAANGREWRTPPLWGIGLIPKVNGHSFLLHDGRARNLDEAILWHGGEAETSRDSFKKMPREDRQALIAFLQSL